MAGVKEVKTPLDAIIANVRTIEQDLSVERTSPLLTPFVDKIWHARCASASPETLVVNR